jgi:hypothetical protein
MVIRLLIVRILSLLSPPLLRMSNPWPWPSRKQDSSYFTDAHTQFKALPLSVVVLATFTLGSATAMSAAMFYRRFGRRIRNVDWVTPVLLSRKRWIKGVVTRSGIISLPLS